MAIQYRPSYPPEFPHHGWSKLPHCYKETRSNNVPQNSDVRGPTQPQSQSPRGWTHYRVRAQLNPSAPGPFLSASELHPHGWTRIFYTGNPIVAQITVATVLIFQIDAVTYRVYPPFVLRDKEAITGLLREAWLPEGASETSILRPVPKHAVTGLVTEWKPIGGPTASTQFYCRGIRIDCSVESDCTPVFKQLLALIAERTHQWWIGQGNDPFNAPDKVHAQVRPTFELALEPVREVTGEIHSAWFAHNGAQRPLGFEVPLSDEIWRAVGVELANGRRPEVGLRNFYNGVSDYMAGDDEGAILNFCLAFEVLENKRRIIAHERDDKFDRILRECSLLSQDDKALMADLFIDRGQIAHGRVPNRLARNRRRMEDYLGVAVRYVNAYLRSVRPGEWAMMSSLRLGEQRAR